VQYYVTSEIEVQEHPIAVPSLPWISAEEVFARVSYLDAVRALQRDLRTGCDPASDFTRRVLDVKQGQLLVMPSASSEFVGVKVATVAPDNPALGKERIQGVYVLMDAATLTPVALLDGAALATLRTPAVSAAVADILAPAVINHAVVFGSGPQASGHLQALAAVRQLGRVTIVARNQERAGALADTVAATGTPTTVGIAEDSRDAQLIVCATTALFFPLTL